jgi:drug/metabolite transporter (DMT)-like permease
MNKSFIKYFAALLIFGTNGLVASHISLSSHEIVFWRSLFGSICLIAIFLLTGNKFTFMKHKKDFMFLALSGLGMGMSWAALYEGYNRIGVGVTTLLYYVGPIFVMVLAPFIFKEKLTPKKIMCFTVVIAGMILVNGSGEAHDVIGILCGIMAAVGYTIMVTTGKFAKNIEGLENPTLQVVFAFVFCAFYHVAKSGLSFDIQITDVPATIILGIFNTGIACYCYFAALGKLNVQTIAICGYLEPLSAVIFSAIFLGETMTAVQVLGAIFIIGGAVCGELKLKHNVGFTSKKLQKAQTRI